MTERTISKNVNLVKSTKLGKIEKLTLLALLEPKKHDLSDIGFKHPEGNRHHEGGELIISEADARAEGGYTIESYRQEWIRINSPWDPDQIVHVVDFVKVAGAD